MPGGELSCRLLHDVQDADGRCSSNLRKAHWPDAQVRKQILNWFKSNDKCNHSWQLFYLLNTNWRKCWDTLTPVSLFILHHSEKAFQISQKPSETLYIYIYIYLYINTYKFSYLLECVFLDALIRKQDSSMKHLGKNIYQLSWTMKK